MGTEMHMEDDDARDRSEQPENPQGADKRRGDQHQGESLPEESAGPGTGSGGGAGVSDGGGASRGGGSTGDAGGASQSGGTGN